MLINTSYWTFDTTSLELQLSMALVSEVFRHQNIFLSILLICVIVSSCMRIAWISSSVPVLSWKFFILQNDAIKRTRHVYVFNWTNPGSVFTKNNTPRVDELGPFVFEEIQNLTDIRWDGNKVSYKRRREWKFLQEHSSDLEMKVTNINVVFAKYLEILRNKTSVTIQRAYDYLIQQHDEKIILTKSARECFFDGYSYSLFNATRFQQPPEKQQFGWFLGMNESVDFVSYSSNGLFEINSKYSFHRQGENWLKYEAMWNRVVQLFRSSETTNFGQKYFGSEDSLSHCADGSNECIVKIVPLTMSLPHFLDRKYPPKVEGMRPNTAHHRPITIHDEYFGNDVESNLTYQLNIQLNPVNWSKTILKNLPATEIPMIWYKDVTNFSAISTENTASHARNLSITTTLNILIAIFSITLAIISVLIFSKTSTYRLLI